MIGYDGPARLALGIIAGCVVIVALALVVGMFIGEGTEDVAFDDTDPADGENAELFALASYRTRRPAPVADEITDAVERVLAQPLHPRKDDAS